MLTLQEKFEAVDALRKIEILFKYFEDPIYLKALKYSRQQLQHEIAVAKAVNEVFVFPKEYGQTKIDKDEIIKAMKEDDGAFGSFIKKLVDEMLEEQQTNYGIIFQKGDNKDD